jgi:DNA-binding LacI/PurR family transcriptional regulator
MKEHPPFSKVQLIDVAHVAGVSCGTVSYVLGGGRGNSRASKETADRVRQVARQLNYKPNPAARRLRGVRTNFYGVLVASAGDPLVSFLVQFLDTEAVKVGCHILICNTIGNTALAPDQFAYHVNELTHQGVDGVFCAVHDWFSGDRFALLQQHPNTIFYENPGIPGACYVTVDREEIGRIAVRRLVERGCRRIGFTAMGLSRPTQLARLRGYKTELAAHGLNTDDRLVFNSEIYGHAAAVCDEHGEKWSIPVGIVDRAVDMLVRDGGVDGIVAHDDFWASAMIRRRGARGIRVPDDVAVVGYLNHYLADWTDPPLTTISRRSEEAARIMVGMMERMLTKGPLPESERVAVIQPKLIARESA